MKMSGEVTEKAEVPDSKSSVAHATEGLNPSLSARFVRWRGDREADGARLEFVCSSRYRGFESLPLRHFIPGSLKRPWGVYDGQGLCNGEAANSARSGRKQR